MTEIRRLAGRIPRVNRPAVPPADYQDDISETNFDKIKTAVAEINDPAHKRTLVSGIDMGD